MPVNRVRLLIPVVVAISVVTAPAVSAYATRPNVAVDVDLAGTGPAGDLEDPAGNTGVRTVAVHCSVWVPEGSSGFVVMNAALKMGCIRSYKTGRPPGWNLTSVTCVDGLCERLVGLFAPFVGATLIWNVPQSLHTYKATDGGRLAYVFGPGCTC